MDLHLLWPKLHGADKISAGRRMSSLNINHIKLDMPNIFQIYNVCTYVVSMSRN